MAENCVSNGMIGKNGHFLLTQMWFILSKIIEYLLQIGLLGHRAE